GGERGMGWCGNGRGARGGHRGAAAGTDGTVSVYDAVGGEVLLRQTMPAPGSLHGLAWHPDSRWLAAGGSDERIYVYDTAGNVLYDTLEGHDDVVTALAWSPDGETLASTAGGPLLKEALIDVSDGTEQTVRLWRWR